jgi:hypothetical protein
MSMPDQEEIEQVAEPEVQNDAPDEAASEADQEIEILVGDEQPEEEEIDEEAAPSWIKTVRQQSREAKKENQELKRRLREMEAKVTAPIDQPELGEEPTLEDHDYDPAAYTASLKKWLAEKHAHDKRKASAEQEQQAAQTQWQQKLAQYGEKKAKLRVSGFADAEAVAQEHLHSVQLGIIIQGADDAAKVIYAIGKDDARAKALAAITDPVKFAFAISKLEASLKTTAKSAPPPSTIPKGSGSKANVNATLDKLRAEAAQTGDMSKVMEYKRKMAQK